MVAANAIKCRIIGSTCILGYVILAGVQEVIIKASNISIVQVSISRFALQLLLATLWWNIQNPINPYICKFMSKANVENNVTKQAVVINNWYGDKPYIINIWLRGILFAVMQILWYIALILLPIGDIQCIFYQAPLLTVYVSALCLKEKLPSYFILIPSTLFTVTGIICISQPTFLLTLIDTETNYDQLNHYGIVSVCISAICWTFAVVLIRTAVNTHFLQLEFASSICLLFICFPILLIVNNYILHIQWIGGFDRNQWSFDFQSIVIMIFIGFNGFSLLLLTVIGYQISDATYISWIECLTIPIGYVYQIIFFNDLPNKYEIVGCVMVTVASLMPFTNQMYIYIRSKENKRNVEYAGVATEESQSEYDSSVTLLH